MMRPDAEPARPDGGFMLLEVLVAMAILSFVMLSMWGIRTSALADAMQARNWRVAREIAEQRLSELRAGARELPPESRIVMPLDGFPDFEYLFLIGERDINDYESETASRDDIAGDGGLGTSSYDHVQWRREQQQRRLARQKGLSLTEVRDHELDRDESVYEALENPSEDELIDVAVVVTFPQVPPQYLGARDSFTLKAKVSSLAISGLTPEAASRRSDGDAGSGMGSGGLGDAGR